MKKLKLKLQLGEGLRELFRREELDRIEPQPHERSHWLRWLLSSEPLEDLDEQPHTHRGWLGWLLASETLIDLPPAEPRKSRLRWLLASEPLGDLPEPEAPRTSPSRRRRVRGDSPESPPAGQTPGTGDQS